MDKSEAWDKLYNKLDQLSDNPYFEYFYPYDVMILMDNLMGKASDNKRLRELREQGVIMDG